MKDVFIDGKWHRLSKRPEWTFTEAQELIGRISELVKPHGYGVALYGSVLATGKGRDLDLMLIPFRPDASNMFDLARDLPALGLTEVRMPGWGHRRALGVLSWLWEDGTERSVDFAFWPVMRAAPDTEGGSS